MLASRPPLRASRCPPAADDGHETTLGTRRIQIVRLFSHHYPVVLNQRRFVHVSIPYPSIADYPAPTPYAYSPSTNRHLNRRRC